jgi:hypothetical protein
MAEDSSAQPSALSTLVSAVSVSKTDTPTFDPKKVHPDLALAELHGKASMIGKVRDAKNDSKLCPC